VSAHNPTSIDNQPATVIGAGLAGSEAAWQLAERGFDVRLFEMRPVRPTPAHVTDRCAELVCSNSFGSILPDRASGQLKWEMEQVGSLILHCAAASAVPAGRALAVDREKFADLVTKQLEEHPRIELIRQEVCGLPEVGVIASGPLTSSPLAKALSEFTGQDYLYFYDALAPLIEAESIDHSIAFRAERYEEGDVGDYINCPMNKAEYERFLEALIGAERIPLRDFENEDEVFFESCLPVEVLATRGREALRFGPMRPVGLTDPRTGRRPWAVVQLRQDNVAGSLYNMVGFQTNLRWGEQEAVLRLIPGLENAEFVRLGQMHRNTFLNSPTLLTPALEARSREGLFFGGQITGVEGYLGNAATGLLAGINLGKRLRQERPLELPPTTMLGALCHYITHAEPKHFQPMKANFGILPPLENPPRDKWKRAELYVERARAHFPTALQTK